MLLYFNRPSTIRKLSYKITLLRKYYFSLPLNVAAAFFRRKRLKTYLRNSLSRALKILITVIHILRSKTDWKIDVLHNLKYNS